MSNVADLPKGFVHYELSWVVKVNKMRVRLKRDRDIYAEQLFSKRFDLLDPDQVKEVNAERPFWLFDNLIGKAKIKDCDPTGAFIVYGKLLIQPDGSATFWRRETE